MSVIAEALKSQLAGHVGLSALIGTRVYPGQLPQKPTLPAVSYFTLANDRLYRHGGPSGDAEPVFQIDIWADTYALARSVAEQVRLAMNAFTGTVSGVWVHHAKCVGERDLYEDETRIQHIAIDFEVAHREAV